MNIKEAYKIDIESAQEIIVEQSKEIERLNNIIKEAREYIVKNTDNTNFIEVPVNELLVILDKENE